MEKTKEQIKKDLEHFLFNSVLSTYEIADMFGMSEDEVVNCILKGE